MTGGLAAEAPSASSFVLRARRIYVGFQPGPRWVEALAIRSGRVVAAGSTAEAWSALGSDAEHVDLGSRVVLPGFIDAHIHLAGYALARQRLRFTPEESLDQVLEKVRAATRLRPSGRFIVGRGWDHSAWGGWPSADMLDRVAPEHPVALTRKDGHALWVNSAALALAGIDAGSAAPEGGEIVLVDGRPTGILKETAQGLVGRVVPATSSEERRQAIREAIGALWRHGIVGCHDMGYIGGGGLDLHEDLQWLRDEGQLGLRVVWYVLREAFDEAIDAGLHRDRGDERLRLGGLKLFLDGTLGSQTAHMLAPFEGQPSNRGLPTMEAEAFRAWVLRAAEAGLPTAVHAIGDAANRVALDGFEAERVRKAGPESEPALLHRIEHAQVLAPEDIPRFAGLSVVASMQPVHLRADLAVAERFWGARCRHAYAWRSLQRAGAALAFGSDAPIETASVLQGLASARLRHDPHGAPEPGWYPDEALDLASAMHAYSEGAAAAAGQQASLGSLRRGRLADLIVLDNDPFDVAANSLPDLRVLGTMIEGDWVVAAVEG